MRSDSLELTLNNHSNVREGIDSVIEIYEERYVTLLPDVSQFSTIASVRAEIDKLKVEISGKQALINRYQSGVNKLQSALMSGNDPKSLLDDAELLDELKQSPLSKCVDQRLLPYINELGVAVSSNDPGSLFNDAELCADLGLLPFPESAKQLLLSYSEHLELLVNELKPYHDLMTALEKRHETLRDELDREDGFCRVDEFFGCDANLDGAVSVVASKLQDKMHAKEADLIQQQKALSKHDMVLRSSPSLFSESVRRSRGALTGGSQTSPDFMGLARAATPLIKDAAKASSGFFKSAASSMTSFTASDVATSLGSFLGLANKE